MLTSNSRSGNSSVAISGLPNKSLQKPLSSQGSPIVSPRRTIELPSGEDELKLSMKQKLNPTQGIGGVQRNRRDKNYNFND